MVSTEVEAVDVNVNVEYKPDRDTKSQAYQSTDGQWNLKYHDIKTRREASDARAKVSVASGDS